MRDVAPQVFLIGRTAPLWPGMDDYLHEVGGEDWMDRGEGAAPSTPEDLVEFGGRLCYDPETEILTQGGWKQFEVLNQNSDQVLTWNRAAERAEFQPFSLVRYNYAGSVLRVAQRGVDLLITPDHRLWAQKMLDGGGWSAWHFATAETVGIRGIWRFRRDSTPVAGRVADEECVIPTRSYRSGVGGCTERDTRELRLPVLAYAKFLGYVISEGFACFPSGGAGPYVGITQSKGSVLDDILAVVAALGLSCREYSDPRKPHVVNIHVHGGTDFVCHVQEDSGSGAHNKRIPRWLMEHSDLRVLDALWAAMWAGDGSMAGESQTYYTVSEGLAGDVQELLIRLGQASSVSSHVRGGSRHYLVRVLQSGTIGSGPSARAWEPYSGVVWCPSTPNGIVYVRRGGNGVWCGNCYRSWKPGLNTNVSKIRTDQGDYLRNILKSRHGSVLEHVSYSFVFHNVSRVLTHELVRHRAGTAVSQESMRFVRLDDLPFWFPDWAKEDEALIRETRAVLARMEWLQKWMALRFNLDIPGTSFAEKKAKTSFMRRFAPDGVATSIMWTANARALRHVIEARTAPGAEEEIRLVFAAVARIMQAEAPALFGDFTEHEDGSWVPEWSKV